MVSEGLYFHCVFFVPRIINTFQQTAYHKGYPLKTVTRAKPLSIRTVTVKSQQLTTLQILSTATQMIHV